MAVRNGVRPQGQGCNRIVTCRHARVTYPFADMNPANLFTHETNTVNLAPGQTLFKTGDPGDVMFILLEGTLDIIVGDTVVEKAERGAIVGEMALIDQSPRVATVIARSECRFAKIDQRRFFSI